MIYLLIKTSNYFISLILVSMVIRNFSFNYFIYFEMLIIIFPKGEFNFTVSFSMINHLFLCYFMIISFIIHCNKFFNFDFMIMYFILFNETHLGVYFGLFLSFERLGFIKIFPNIS